MSPVIKAVILYADGTMESLHHMPSLDQMQKIVQGYLEVLVSYDHDFVVQINEGNEILRLQLKESAWTKMMRSMGFWFPDVPIYGAMIIHRSGKELSSELLLDIERRAPLIRNQNELAQNELAQNAK